MVALSLHGGEAVKLCLRSLRFHRRPPVYHR